MWFGKWDGRSFRGGYLSWYHSHCTCYQAFLPSCLESVCAAYGLDSPCKDESQTEWCSRSASVRENILRMGGFLPPVSEWHPSPPQPLWLSYQSCFRFQGNQPHSSSTLHLNSYLHWFRDVSSIMANRFFFIRKKDFLFYDLALSPSWKMDSGLPSFAYWRKLFLKLTKPSVTQDNTFPFFLGWGVGGVEKGFGPQLLCSGATLDNILGGIICNPWDWTGVASDKIKPYHYPPSCLSVPAPFLLPK